jgi:hypothetical protein
VVFVIGHQVGDVARQIYDTAGNGRLIDVNEIGWDAAFADTSAWLATTPAPLFEAAIRIEGALTGTNSQVTPRFGRRRHQIRPASSLLCLHGNLQKRRATILGQPSILKRKRKPLNSLPKFKKHP